MRRPGVRIPTTQHMVDVVEVLKGEGTAPGATIIVSQAVGETSDGLVKHDGGGDRFSPGEEYVLFLESSRAGGYGPAWGHGGAYRIVGDTVTIPYVARRIWDNRDAIPALEMLKILHQLRARTRKQADRESGAGPTCDNDPQGPEPRQDLPKLSTQSGQVRSSRRAPKRAIVSQLAATKSRP